MKSFYLLPLVVMFAMSSIAKAAETEPNNTSTQAGTLALNGNNTGRINPKGDVDWWKVTTNADGKLNVKLVPTGKFTWFYLYDTNGTTLLDSSNSNSSFTKSKDGLAAGLYYIKVKTVSANDTVSYTISNTLTLIAQANDAEPNNSKVQAVVIAQNTAKTGHLGFYNSNKRDTSDWYKVTTASDGLLKLKLTPATEVSVSAYLYDSNGTTLLKSGAAASTFYVSADGLAKGTYYVKLNCTTSAQFTPYTITDSLYAPAQANDIEPNDTRAQALALSPNSTKTGHIGYYYKNRRDTTDWYKITTTSDGLLKLKFTPANGSSLSLYLYDNNGTSLLASGTAASAFSISKDGLAAGTYYVKLNCTNGAQFTAYTLTDSLNSPAQANDAEPNNLKTQSLVLGLNSSKTGHVGYYYNNKRDTTDWYKIATTSNKYLRLKITPANGQVISATLYANNGTSFINSGSGSTAFNINTDGLLPDTYYVKLNCQSTSGFAPYTLTDSVYNPATDTLTLPVNFATKYKLKVNGDKNWWRLKTTNDGKISITLNPSAGKFVWIYLYDRNGTTLINSNYSNIKFTLATDGLAAGTYLVKVNSYYPADTTSYTLADTLTLPGQANDVEPNDTRAQALTLNVNSTKTGHSGYYYNNRRDSADWYKVTTSSNGLLRLKLTPHNGTYVWVYLYDNNGTTLLKSDYSNAAFTMNTDGLAAGTYYVKVNCYYNSHFAPYTLTDSLYLPAQANDAEPNDNRAQALLIPVNSSKTGHVGYYNNNRRDTADWYRVTTTSDGMIKLKLTPHNGSYLWVYLYDNNGTTLLNSDYSNTSLSMNTDGLAAGTYYLKVNCYYNNHFTPYTLTDSLFQYSYANDAEPNNKPYQALTMVPNSTVTGHTNFYYQLRKDSADWWKLNYTGTGSLKFTLNLAPKKLNGTIPYVWLYVYKDTAASPVFSNYFNTASNIINLTALAKANYYVKVIPYYASDWDAYSIVNSFTAGSPLYVASPGIVSIGYGAVKVAAKDEEVKLFPNPAATRFRIQVSGDTQGFSSVSLKNAGGRQVWVGSTNLLSLKSGGIDVSVASLQPGIYFLTLTTKDNRLITKKVVVSR